MNVRFLLPAVLVGSSLVLAAFAAIGVTAGPSGPPATDQVPLATPEVGPLTKEAAARIQTDSAISEAERHEVDSLVASSGVLAALRGDVGYSVDSTSEWTIEGKRLGVVAILTLDHPVSLKGELPGIDIGVRGEHADDRVPLAQPYVKVQRQVDSEAQVLYVFVDLASREVVQILPGPAQPEPTEAVTQ